MPTAGREPHFRGDCGRGHEPEPNGVEASAPQRPTSQMRTTASSLAETSRTPQGFQQTEATDLLVAVWNIVILARILRNKGMVNRPRESVNETQCVAVILEAVSDERVTCGN